MTSKNTASSVPGIEVWKDLIEHGFDEVHFNHCLTRARSGDLSGAFHGLETLAFSDLRRELLHHISLMVHIAVLLGRHKDLVDTKAVLVSLKGERWADLLPEGLVPIITEMEEAEKKSRRRKRRRKTKLTSKASA